DTHRWQGNVLRDQGEPDKARMAYGKAVELHEELVQDYPEVGLYQVALANTLLNTTSLPSRSDQDGDAEATTRRMLELYRSAVHAEPNNSHFKMELALGLERQGYIFLQAGRTSDAEGVFREAVEIHQTLFNGGRRKGSIERPLARSFSGLGRV